MFLQRQYNFTRRERQHIEQAYGVKAHQRSLVMSINASSSVKLQIGFTPHDNTPLASLILIRYVTPVLLHCCRRQWLYIAYTLLHGDMLICDVVDCRNNLTILETVVVQGAGQRGDMRFGNKKTGSTLIFEVTEKNCDSKYSTLIQYMYIWQVQSFIF